MPEFSIFSLQGKHALVTGATGHLGSAIAEGLAQAGAHVFVNGRSPEMCDQVCAKLNKLGLAASTAAFDVTSQSSIEAFRKSVLERPIDILVNNAYSGSSGNIEATKSAEVYAESYDITVISAHRIFLSLLPNLRKACAISGQASIINIASMYGLVSPYPPLYSNRELANPPFYGAAKAALLQWTRYAACEFGKEGLRVNAISPGPFPDEKTQNQHKGFIKQLEQRVPLGRVGQPEELKGICTFLASPASSFVNGANFVVDGGWTSW